MTLQRRVYVLFPMDDETFRILVLQYPGRTFEFTGCHRRAPPDHPFVVLRHKQILDPVDDDGWSPPAGFGEIDF